MRNYMEKLRTKFNRKAFCDIYVTKCGISKQGAEQFLIETLKIQQMSIPGLNWQPTSHLISIYPDIPLHIHYEALAAAFSLSFDGIENFYINMINNGLLPAWHLNQTKFYALPNPDLFIGHVMCELGLISDITLQRCLGIQVLIENEGLKPAIAMIISAIERISIPDLFQALSIQCQIPFINLDESAPEIFKATGTRFNSKRI